MFNTAQTITLTTTELVINSELTITGTGENLLTVSGNNERRVFVIFGNANVTLNNLTIANGYVKNSDGGGIFNIGILTINNSIVRNNFAFSEVSDRFGVGGGIANAGTLTINNSILNNNNATN